MSSHSNLTIRVATAGVPAATGDLRRLGHEVVGLGKRIVSVVAAPLLAGGAIYALQREIRGVVEMGAQFADVRDETGETVQNLTAIDIAMKRIGGSVKDVTKLAAQMQRYITEAITPVSTTDPQMYIRTWAALGLDPKALAKMNLRGQLLAIADAMNKEANATKRADLAQAAFGQSGLRMLALFRDPVAMRILREGGGTFGAVMARQADSLKNFQAQLTMVPYYMREVTAGMLDMFPLKEWSDKIQGAFDSVDFTLIGQKVGAWVNLVIEDWKAGKVDQIIGLTIRAGFEIGETGIAKLIEKLKSFFGQDQMKLLGVTLASDITEAMEKAVVEIYVMLGKAFVEVTLVFASFMEQKLADVMNWFVGVWNAAVLTRGMSKLMMNPVAQPDFAGLQAQADRQMKDITAGGEVLKGWYHDFFQRGRDAAKELWGNSQDKTGGKSAIQQLADMINAQVAKRNASAPTETPGPITGISVTKSAKDILLEQQTQLTDKLIAKTKELAAIEGDYTKTSAEKYAQKKQILQEESELLDVVIQQNKTLINSPNISDTDKQLLLTRNQQYGKQQAGYQNQLSKLGPDPNSLADQFISKFTKIQDSLGTWQEQFAQFLTSPFEAMDNGIASAFDDMMMHGANFSRFMQNLGTGLYQSFSQSLSKMVSDWITSHIIMRGFSTIFYGLLKMLGLTDLAVQLGFISAKTAAHIEGETVATAATTTGASTRIAAHAAAAGAGAAESQSSVPYVGPILAIAAMGAIVAAVLALSGGFEVGGFTGGRRGQVAGVVHGEEYVFSAPAVDRLGVATLDALHSGRSRGAIRDTAASALGQHTTNLQLAMFGGEADAKRWADSQDGEVWFLNMMNRHAARYARRT